jgi:hypothetical protein
MLAKPNATGFDSLTSRSLSLWPSRPCRGFPVAPFSTSLGMTRVELHVEPKENHVAVAHFVFFSLQP